MEAVELESKLPDPVRVAKAEKPEQVVQLHRPEPTSKPKRSGNRHRPGYFTEYMREYRKGIRRRKAK